jgi:hypothetical protein
MVMGDFKSPGSTGLKPLEATVFILNDVQQGLMGYMTGSE